MQTSERTVAAPFGGLRVTASETGIRAVSFLAAAPESTPAPKGTAADAIAERAAAQLTEYLAGRRRDFDLPLDWDQVVSFRRQVLDVLYRSVGYGETVTYQQLAERSGQPGAARVVGQIMGSNPLPVVVPCHRVTASGGELGGFGGGLETKRWLLELEGSMPPRLPF
ncbi:MAG TPA: methylated-DNA--[protein]-cysteine S-methyltransferase [Mycobacteriales bacterium]|jgi:methylated-DNA-[protein]-cysteine S-methyltransferase|nr:methylated-DNA--[protein]-cysteine S-methyltransferase [Mycobacteriales bacterium]